MDIQENIAHLFMDVIELQMKDSIHGQKFNYSQELLLHAILF
jgi:hypothetical protein